MFPVERLYFSLLSNFILGDYFVVTFLDFTDGISSDKVPVFVVRFQAEIDIVFDER